MQPKISLFLEYERKSVDPKRTPLHKSWALLSVYFQVWDRLIFACAIGNKWQTDTRSCLLAQAFSQCMEHWDWLFHNPQTAVRQVATVDRTSVQLAALWSRGRVSLPAGGGGGEGRQGLHPRHMAFPSPRLKHWPVGCCNDCNQQSWPYISWLFIKIKLTLESGETKRGDKRGKIS